MDSREHSVEIREFKEYGLDKTAIKEPRQYATRLQDQIRRTKMKIKIDIGTRGTLKEFKKSYQRKFLEKYGYKAYGHVTPFGSFVILAETVETKYGELVVHDNDVVTYVGNKHWSVSHETMVGKSPDNQE